MAKKKENLKDLKAGELETRLESLRATLRGIHFKTEGTRSKNVREARGLRKDIARILTVMNHK